MTEIPLEVQSNRFLLRPLTVHDINDRYAGWLKNSATNDHIKAKLDINGVIIEF